MNSDNSVNETLLKEFKEKVSREENGMQEVLSPRMIFVSNTKNWNLVKEMNNSDPFPKSSSSQLQDLQVHKLHPLCGLNTSAKSNNDKLQDLQVHKLHPLCGLNTSAKSNNDNFSLRRSFPKSIKESRYKLPEFRCKIKSESEVVYARSGSGSKDSEDALALRYMENGENKFTSESQESADAYTNKLPLPAFPLRCSSPLGAAFFCSPISINVNPQTCIEMSGSCAPSPAVRSFFSYGPICRICHDGDDKERFISPCECSGSVALVHKTCLEKWLSTSANEGKCELCNFVFLVERKPKSFSQFLCERSNSFERRAILSDFAGLCILTPLILATTFLCITGALNLSKNEGSIYPFKFPGHKSGDQVPYFYNGSHRNNFFLNATLSENVTKNGSASKGPFSGLVILSLVLLAIYIAWVTIAVKYHRKAWLVWRASNQQVHLTEAQALHS